jgi:hypothetical protein
VLRIHISNNIIAVPQTPENLNVLNITPQDVYIIWEQDPHDIVSNFVVAVKYIGTCNMIRVKQSVSSVTRMHHVHINMLEEFSSYNITVTAVNSAGNSSSYIIIQTLSRGKDCHSIDL